MKTQVIYKLFQLKGIIDSMGEMAGYDSTYEHPMLEKLEETINEVITQVGETKIENSKVIFPPAYALTQAFENIEKLNNNSV